MELYLVYEFIYHNFDEDREEGIEFFELHKSKEKARRVANKRVKKGIKEYDVVLSEEISNTDNPFEETDTVDMYREGDEIETPIYSICIKKFKIGRKDEK